MMTKQNMLTAAMNTMKDADEAPQGSATQFEAVTAALHFAAMLIGASQAPWDQEMVDVAWRIKRDAETLLQACVGAQCDEHYASGKKDGEAKANRHLYDAHGL